MTQEPLAHALPVYIPRERASARFWLVYFFSSIVLIGTVGFTLSAPFFLLGRLAKRPRRTAATIMRHGVAVLLKVQPWLNADVRIQFRRLGSNRGTLYVSNHRSTLDVFFLLAYVDGVRILSKKTLAFVPLLGEMMWLSRQIFVANRRPEAFLAALRRLELALADGDHVHVFPEMTRCRPGLRGTQKFTVAPFQVACTRGATVVPVVFHDTDLTWPKGYYGLSFRRPVRVEALAPLEAAAYGDARALMTEVRSRIDAALEARR